MRRAAGVFVFAAMTSLATSASAAPPLAQSLKGDARVLYDSARDLFKNGDYASAYAKFQHAHELSGDPRLYWNMAACERKANHNANVLRLIDVYLREGDALLSDDDKKEAARAAAAVRSFVASATVKTEPNDGVEIFVDDVRVGATPVERIWIDAGAHHVRFAKSAYRTVERSEDIPAGASLSWSVTLEREGEATTPPPAPPPRTTPPPDERHPDEPATPRSRTGPFILGGAGIALALGGGALAYVTTTKFSSLRDDCGTSCDRSQWESYRTMQYVGNGLLIAGGVAIIGAIVWLAAR